MNLLFWNYFLYDIRHPNKSGLPQIDLLDDKEASIDTSSAPRLSPVEIII